MSSISLWSVPRQVFHFFLFLQYQLSRCRCQMLSNVFLVFASCTVGQIVGYIIQKRMQFLTSLNSSLSLEKYIFFKLLCRPCDQTQLFHMILPLLDPDHEQVNYSRKCTAVCINQVKFGPHGRADPLFSTIHFPLQFT